MCPPYTPVGVGAGVGVDTRSENSRAKFKCCIDIEGYQTPSHGTLPPSVIVTTLKPDMVIIDQKNKSIHIFELTVPKETKILAANKLKLEKYQHFSSDITSYKVMLTPFKVGSQI